MGLEAGDVHINAKNNLIIEAEKVLINGNEIDSSISVKQDNDEFSTGSIRFKDSDSIKFSIIPDGDSVDVYSRIITEPLTDPIATYDTAFPTDPVDGQEFTLVSSTTSSTYYWRFRYNASSTQTYL